MSLPESSKNLTTEMLRVGDPAPEFELRAVTGADRHKVNLEDYRGKKNVVLAFYVANWTPV
jgi:peroxiredoxin